MNSYIYYFEQLMSNADDPLKQWRRTHRQRWRWVQSPCPIIATLVIQLERVSLRSVRLCVASGMSRPEFQRWLNDLLKSSRGTNHQVISGQREAEIIQFLLVCSGGGQQSYVNKHYRWLRTFSLTDYNGHLQLIQKDNAKRMCHRGGGTVSDTVTCLWVTQDEIRRHVSCIGRTISS